MRHTARWVLAVFAVGVLTQVSIPLLDARTGVVADNVLLTVIALVTTVGHVSQARRSRGRRRCAWALAGVAAALWSASSVVDTVDAFRQTDTMLDELLAVGAALCSPVALILLGAIPKVGIAAVLRRALDIATVAGAVFFLAWEFVLGPAYATLPRSVGLLVILVVLPMLVGSAYAVVLLSRSLSHRGDVALSLLGAGLMSFAVTMVLTVHNLVEGLPWYATGVGAGYVVAGLLTALASHSPPPAETFARENHTEGRWALLPYLPVVLAFAAAAWHYVRTGDLTAVLFWLLLATSVLVLTRQFLSLHTNQKLTRELEHQRAELAYQAAHDPLTGLVNRLGFRQLADAALVAAEPDGLTGVLLVDLDGFKAVNDTHGHAAGDALLVGVADRLRSATRDSDTVARLGGDEFVVLIPGLHHADEVADVGARVLDELSRPMDLGVTTLTVRASVGATVGTGARAAPLELVEEADIALYQAKAAGKGVVRHYRAGAAEVAARLP